MSAVVFCAAAGSSGVSTTALLVAAMSDRSLPVVFAEFDPSGGDLAAWFESTDPARGLASLVTEPDRSLTGVARHVQTLPSGLAVWVAPTRTVQASVAVGAVSGWLVPMLAAAEGFRTVCDAGRVDPAGVPPVVTQAGLVVVVVRQAEDSAPATTARVERAVELVGRLAPSDIPTGLVVIGTGPYRPDDLAGHIDTALLGVLPVDGRGAATACGAWTLRGSAGRSILAGAARTLAAGVWAHLDAVSPAGLR